MNLSRLSLLSFSVAALVPALTLAAPATTLSELLTRVTADGGPRQFSLQATIAESPLTTDVVSVAVRGKMQGTGTGAIAHGTVAVQSEGETMRFRMAMLENTLYLKLSNAGDSQDTLGMEDDLGVNPWISLDMGPETDPLSPSADLSVLDSLLAVHATASNGKGGTIYTIGFVPRPALAFSQMMAGEWSLFGESPDDLDLRRADGWIRDSVSVLMHLEELADGRVGAGDFSLSVVDGESTSVTVTASSAPLSQSFTLVKPLLTVSLEDVLASQGIDADWSSFFEGSSELLPTAGQGAVPEGCTTADVRRGTCPAIYQSRRLLDY